MTVDQAEKVAGLPGMVKDWLLHCDGQVPPAATAASSPAPWC